jgi:hypothetical protein
MDLVRRALPFLLPVIALTSACHPEKPQPLRDPPDPPASEDSIPVAPLDGKLLGDAFKFKSGRYTIDQRPGYEKIDIKLYPVATDTPCADPPGKPASVWLRRRGVTRVEAGVTRVDVKKGGDWEVHYQRFGEEGWIGNGDAAALLSIDDVGPDMKIDGALYACFRDTTGSCVKGKFSAVYCRIHIDAPVRGSEAMERPPQKPLPKTAQGDTAGVLAPVPVTGTAPPDSAKAGAP